jgi:hypothetical protein
MWVTLPEFERDDVLVRIEETYNRYTTNDQEVPETWHDTRPGKRAVGGPFEKFKSNRTKANLQRSKTDQDMVGTTTPSW